LINVILFRSFEFVLGVQSSKYLAISKYPSFQLLHTTYTSTKSVYIMI